MNPESKDTGEDRYKTWHIPLKNNQVILEDALQNMHDAAHEQADIPLIVQLIENPRYHFPGFCLFHGAVNLKDHDCIHLILGRGMMPKDEAFVIGFTMGSTHKVGKLEEKIYGFITRYLYPPIYHFSKNDLVVFRKGLRLGALSHCKSLDKVDYRSFMKQPLNRIRQKLGINVALLQAYYHTEAFLFPHCVESTRLLD